MRLSKKQIFKRFRKSSKSKRVRKSSKSKKVIKRLKGGASFKKVVQAQEEVNRADGALQAAAIAAKGEKDTDECMLCAGLKYCTYPACITDEHPPDECKWRKEYCDTDFGVDNPGWSILKEDACVKGGCEKGLQFNKARKNFNEKKLDLEKIKEAWEEEKKKAKKTKDNLHRTVIQSSFKKGFGKAQKKNPGPKPRARGAERLMEGMNSFFP